MLSYHFKHLFDSFSEMECLERAETVMNWCWLIMFSSCVQKYYGSELKSSDDVQSNATSCGLSRSVPKSVTHALSLVHPEVTKKYYFNFFFALFTSLAMTGQYSVYYFIHTTCRFEDFETCWLKFVLVVVVLDCLDYNKIIINIKTAVLDCTFL